MPIAQGSASSVLFQVAPAVACQAGPQAGGRITGRGGTNKLNLDDGSANSVQVTLVNADTGNDEAVQYFAARLGGSDFVFDNLADGRFLVRLSDDDGAARDSPRLEVACTPVACDLAFVPASLTSAPNTNPRATRWPGSAGYGLGTGSVTVQATSSAPGPIRYALPLGGAATYYAPAVAGDPITLGLSAPGVAPAQGLVAGTYDVLALDSRGCAIRTTITVEDSFVCDITVDVKVIEDVAFIRNNGNQVLEYDWQGNGTFTDQRFRSGLNADDHTVRVRDKNYPACFVDVDFVVVPYPSPRLCCLCFLVVGGEWHHIEEPLRLNAQELVIKRDPKLHGVSFEYGEMALGFTCDAGFGLIDTAYQAEGPDAEIGFVELGRDPLSPPLMKVTYSGRLNLYECDRTDGAFNCNVEATGLATLLAARLKTSVDLLGALDLDGKAVGAAAVQDVVLHSKAILKVGHFVSDGVFAATGEIDRGAGGNTATVILGYNTPVVEDLKTFYSQNSGFSLDGDTWPFFVSEEAGIYDVDFLVKGFVKVQHNSGAAFNARFRLYYRINNDPPELLLEYFGPSTAAASFHTDQFNGGLGLNFTARRSRAAAVADEFYLYGTVDVIGLNGSDVYSWDYQMELAAESFVKATAQTIAPDSVGTVIPMYEALDRGLELLLGSPGLLRSTYFGRPDSSPRAYPAQGEGGRFALASGLMIRGVGAKPFPAAAQDLLDGAQPIFNVGLAVEDDGPDAQAIRVERAADFYENRLALRLDAVDKFSRKVDASRSYNLVNIGYEKWQPEGRVENGLDEPLARRQYSTPVRLNTAEYKQLSKFVAGSYLLEAQRRVGTSGDDAKNDQDTFILSLATGPNNALVMEGFQSGNQSIIVAGSQKKLVVGQPVEVLSGPNAGVYTVTGWTFQTVNIPLPAPGKDVPATIVFIAQVLPAAFGPNTKVYLGDQVQAERNEGFAQVANLYSPETTYNLRLSPARNLRRHAAFLNSATWFKSPVDLYRPTVAEGNQALQTRLIGEATVLDEAAPIQRQQLAPLADTLFIPEILNFESYLDQEGFDRLRAVRHGYVAAFDGVDWYTGYILTVKWLREKNKGTFELLRRAGAFDPASDAVTLREYNPTEYNPTEHN